MINRIKTKNAPKAIGVYSQGSIYENLVFTSGQIAINPISGNLVTDDFSKEVEQVLHNVNAVLVAGGSSLKKAAKLTVFLTDLSKFGELNKVFLSYFGDATPPARSAVQVTALPLGARVEIEAVGTL